MRQAGILAAAGLYALEHHVDRLAEDHHNAGLLANGIQKFEELRVENNCSQTNMVFIDIDADLCRDLATFLLTQHILISPGRNLRLVAHLDITTRDVKKIISTMSSFFSSTKNGRWQKRTRQR